MRGTATHNHCSASKCSGGRNNALRLACGVGYNSCSAAPTPHALDRLNEGTTSLCKTRCCTSGIVRWLELISAAVVCKTHAVRTGKRSSSGSPNKSAKGAGSKVDVSSKVGVGYTRLFRLRTACHSGKQGGQLASVHRSPGKHERRSEDWGRAHALEFRCEISFALRFLMSCASSKRRLLRAYIDATAG